MQFSVKNALFSEEIPGWITSPEAVGVGLRVEEGE